MLTRAAHAVLAAYSLGASPSLLEDILKLHHETAFVREFASLPIHAADDLSLTETDAPDGARRD